MTAPTSPTGAAHGSALARAPRYLIRVPMLLWHALVHLPLLLLVRGRARADERGAGHP